MDQYNRYAQAAAAGAALLDSKRPGWAETIDTERLNMSSPDNCIVGQVGALNDYPYLAGLRTLGFNPCDPSTRAQERALGFELVGDDARATAQDWAELRAAWLDEIDARRITFDRRGEE